MTITKSRMTRIFFFAFVAQNLSHNNRNHAVDAAKFTFPQAITIESCKNYGINAGKSLEEDCVKFCYPNTIETFDWADNDEDRFYVVRNTICRCFEEGESPDVPKRMSFECESKAEVWDKSKPVMKCLEDYDIDDRATCESFCSKIDPIAYMYKGYTGNSQCFCNDIMVCNDIIPKSSANSRTLTSVLVVLLSGCVMAFWS